MYSVPVYYKATDILYTLLYTTEYSGSDFKAATLTLSLQSYWTGLDWTGLDWTGLDWT